MMALKYCNLARKIDLLSSNKVCFLLRHSDGSGSEFFGFGFDFDL